MAKDRRGFSATCKTTSTLNTHPEQKTTKARTNKDVLIMSCSPTSPEYLLRARFCGLFRAKPVQRDPSFPQGHRLILIASRLRRSTALDDTILCFVAGAFAHQSQTEDSVKIARKSHGRALSSLLCTLMGHDKNVAFTGETIAADKLLSAFEVGSFD
jgi:hypothetical protein